MTSTTFQFETCQINKETEAIGKEGNVGNSTWNALEMLAAVVVKNHSGNSSNDDKIEFCKPVTTSLPINQSTEHRVSCHRCGNIRKRKVVCPAAHCPHIFCGRCADKLKLEHGPNIFNGGCPVCRESCCCSNKTRFCDRKNHCYRKCPASRARCASSMNTPEVGSASLQTDDDYEKPDIKRCRLDLTNVTSISSHGIAAAPLEHTDSSGEKLENTASRDNYRPITKLIFGPVCPNPSMISSIASQPSHEKVVKALSSQSQLPGNSLKSGQSRRVDNFHSYVQAFSPINFYYNFD